jgi:hypothetical protein
MTLTTQLCCVLRLKEEQSYTSAPPLGLHGLLEGEHCFTFTHNIRRQIHHIQTLWIYAVVLANAEENTYKVRPKSFKTSIIKHR